MISIDRVMDDFKSTVSGRTYNIFRAADLVPWRRYGDHVSGDDELYESDVANFILLAVDKTPEGLLKEVRGLGRKTCNEFIKWTEGKTDEALAFRHRLQAGWSIDNLLRLGTITEAEANKLRKRHV